MYRVQLTHDNAIIATAEHQFFTEAAERAADAMPAMYMAVSGEVVLSCSKNGERVFNVPLSVHLAAIAPVEQAA